MIGLFIIASFTIISIALLIHETYMVKITDLKEARKRSIILLVAVLFATIYVGFDDSMHTVRTLREKTVHETTIVETIQHEKNIMFKSKRVPIDKDKCPGYQSSLRAQHGIASQYGQDVVLYQIFKEYKNGVFIDLAAAFPKKLSNTYWIETCKDWAGFCIEGDPRKIVDLVKNRICQVIPECVTETARTVSFGDSAVSGINGINDGDREGSFKLNCRPLNVLLKDYGSPQRIDYMSLDVEGAEPEALNSIGDYIVDTITIELAHLRKDKKKSADIKKFLISNKYVPVTGFPIIIESPNRNFGNFCKTKKNGAKLWNNTIDEIFNFKGNMEYHTHDVFFVRQDSIHFNRINELFNC